MQLHPGDTAAGHIGAETPPSKRNANLFGDLGVSPFWSRRFSAPIATQREAATKPLATQEEFCVKNAALFVAARGRTLANRTRQQFATLNEAQAFAAVIGDRRTMIHAVTTLRHSGHITNA